MRAAIGDFNENLLPAIVFYRFVVYNSINNLKIISVFEDINERTDIL